MRKNRPLYMKMDGLLKILGSQFPPLLVMEYLPGSEYTVDVLKTEKYTIIPRKEMSFVLE